MSTKRSRDIRSAAVMVGFMLVMALGTVQIVFPYLEIFFDIDMHRSMFFVLATAGFTILYLFLAMTNAGRILFFIWAGLIFLWLGLVLMRYGFGLYDAFIHSWLGGTVMLISTIIIACMMWLWKKYRG